MVPAQTAGQARGMADLEDAQQLWRARDDMDDGAGELMAALDTLRGIAADMGWVSAAGEAFRASLAEDEQAAIDVVGRASQVAGDLLAAGNARVVS